MPSVEIDTLGARTIAKCSAAAVTEALRSSHHWGIANYCTNSTTTYVGAQPQLVQPHHHLLTPLPLKAGHV